MNLLKPFSPRSDLQPGSCAEGATLPTPEDQTILPPAGTAGRVCDRHPHSQRRGLDRFYTQVHVVAGGIAADHSGAGQALAPNIFSVAPADIFLNMPSGFWSSGAARERRTALSLYE